MLILMLGGFAGGVMAQAPLVAGTSAANYEFSALGGAAAGCVSGANCYTTDRYGNTIDMSSGTTGLITVATTSFNLTGLSTFQNIPFDFYFFGTKQTQFQVNILGTIGFPATGGNNAINQGISVSNTFDNTNRLQISPVGTTSSGAVGYGSTTTSRVEYKVFGSAPNRVLVVGWKNIRFPSSTTTTNRSNFQCRIYEQSNIVEYAYGNQTNPVITNGAGTFRGVMRVNGASGNFNNLQGTANSAAALTNSTSFTAGWTYAVTTQVSPLSQNLKIAYDPTSALLATPNSPPTAMTLTPDNNQITVGWADASNELSYVIYYTTNSNVPIDGTSSTAVTAAQNATSATITGLTNGTTYYFKLFALREALSTPVTGNAIPNPACTGPTTQATIGSYTGNTSGSSIDVNWTRGDGTAGVIVVAKQGGAPTAPTSGTAYTADAAFGNSGAGYTTAAGSHVVYNGTGTTVNVTGLSASTSYTFAVYEYNTTGTCYKYPGAFSAVVTTDTTAPVISYTALGNTFSTSNRLASGITITDAGAGINTTAGTKPRLYYKKSGDDNTYVDNTSATNGWKYVEASGTTSPFSFTINYALLNAGSVSLSDVIQYFVVAQDLATTPNLQINSGTYTAAPASVALTSGAFPLTGSINSYTISTLSGSITVGTGGDFTTFTRADGFFNFMNSATVYGNLTVSVVSDITTEDGTAGLNQWAESGAGNYTLTIQSDGSVRSVSGAYGSGALYRINGADRVTFNGGTVAQRNLVFTNTTPLTGSVATLGLMNDATNNSFNNCTFRGEIPLLAYGIGSSTGVVVISTGTSTGNDNLTFDKCDITRSATGAPNNGIYAAGSASFPNDNISITNCNIYNFNFANLPCGINVTGTGNGNNWTITGNSFYSTIASGSSFGGFNSIKFNPGSSSTGNTISGNFIGGTAASCGGSEWYSFRQNTGDNVWTGIYVNVGTGSATNVTNNTIKNFSSTTSTITGIEVAGGTVNVGNGVGTGNTIGGLATASSYNITASSPVRGVLVSGGTVNVLRNTISGIANRTSTTGISFTGILVTGGDVNVGNGAGTGNTIGSISSSTAISLSTVNTNPAYGIRNTGNGTVLIDRNTVAGMESTHALVGIQSANASGGSATISNNSVYNLTSYDGDYMGTAPAGDATKSSTMGIWAAGNSSVIGNTVYGLTTIWSSSTYAYGVTGIYFNPNNTSAVVEKNFVHSLNLGGASTSAFMYGISIGSSTNTTGVSTTVKNNMIRLGLTTTGGNVVDGAVNSAFIIAGIDKWSTSAMNIYHNSVYVGGTVVATGAANTSAFRRSVAPSSGSDDVRNNIFSNERSNAASAGKHYGVSYNNTTGVTSNFNLYYTPGTGGNLGSYDGGTTAQNSIANLTTASGGSQELNSITGDPLFTAPTAALATVNLHVGVGSPAGKTGIPITSVTDDYDSQTRPCSPIDMGSDAFNLTNAAAPTITFGSSPAIIAAVCISASAQTSTLAYSATLNNPLQYSIVWGASAITAGFAAVTSATLPATPISISIPAGAAANTYTGTLTVDNLCLTSANYTISVTVNPPVTTPNIIAAISGSEPACQAGATMQYQSSFTGMVGTQSWSVSSTDLYGTPPYISTPFNGTFMRVTWNADWAGETTITVVNTGCNGPSASQTRTFTTAPTVTQPVAISLVSGTEPTCQLTSNATTTYSSSTTYGTLSWSVTNVSTIAGTAPTVSGSTVTWYAGWSGSADVTVKSTGCNGPSATQTRTITVSRAVTQPTAIGISSGAVPTCQSGTGAVVVYSSSATYGTLSWALTGITTNYGTAPTLSGSTVTINGDWAGSATIVVSTTGCNGTLTATRNIVVNPSSTNANPVSIAASGTLNLCTGGSVTLIAPTASGQTYAWKNNGAVISGATASIYTATTAGSYTVTLNSTVGCSATSTASVVTVNAIPAMPSTLTGTTMICTLTSGTYTASTVSGALSYTWTLPSGLTGNSTTNSINVAINDVNFSSGSITVKANTAYCTSTAKSLTIAKVPATPSSLTGSPTVTCGITSGSYSCSPSTGATQYNWTLPLGITGSSSTNSISATINNSTFTSGNISVKASNTCGISAAKTLAVSKVPFTPSTISGPTITCGLTSATYTVTTGTNVSTYTWTLPAGITGTSNSNSITVSINNSVFTSGNISVIANNACGSSPAKTLAVNRAPSTPSSITGPTQICGLTAATYTCTAMTGATSYTWAFPAGLTGTSTTNSITVDINTTLFTGGNVSVQAANSCGISAAKTLALTKTLPASTTISGPSNICGLTTATYIATAVSGASSYAWILPAGLTGSSSTNTITVSVNASAYTSGTISVQPLNACGSGAAKTFTLTKIPATPTTLSGPSAAVCAGSTQTYTCTAMTNASAYTWTVPSGAVINSGQGTTSVSVSFPSTFSSGTVSVTANSSCGNSAVKSLTVASKTATPGTISGTTTNLCVGGTYTYSIAAVSGAVSYTWTAPSGCSFSGSNSGTSVSLVVPAGFVSGTLSVVANNACGASTAKTLSLTGTPTSPTTLTGPTSVCPSSTGHTFTTTPVTGATNYVWTVPTGASITSGSGSNSITVNWGSLAGSVTVKSGNACGVNSTAKTLAVALATCRVSETELETEDSSTVAEIKLYPNPLSSFFTLEIYSDQINTQTIRLTDMLGKILINESKSLLPGSNTFTYNLSDYASGLYMISVSNSKKQQVFKLVKE